MSRDIFVQDIPFDAQSVGDIPDGFEPQPLKVTPEHVRAVITAIIQNIVFDSAGWANIVAPGVDIEVTVEDDDPFESFAFSDRSSDRAAADALVGEILDTLDLRAFDVDSESGIFG
jgi:hypothetical protein